MPIDFKAQLRDPDPNEAYEIVPTEDGWFIVLQNGIPYCNERYLVDAKEIVSHRKFRDHWRMRETNLRPNPALRGKPSKMEAKAYMGLHVK